jgi:hypothetical protein
MNQSTTYTVALMNLMKELKSQDVMGFPAQSMNALLHKLNIHGLSEDIRFIVLLCFRSDSLGQIIVFLLCFRLFIWGFVEIQK